MSARRVLPFAASALLAGADALAQQPVPGGRIVVLEEGARVLRVYDDASLDPARGDVPEKLRLLRLALQGRAAADALDPTLPQQSEELGVAAIALPGGGWIVKYRDSARAEAGFLHVGADGAPAVLLALPLAGGVDPFLDAIAVSGVEARAAVVEDEDVGGRGDAWLLRFDGGVFASTGTAARRVTASSAAPDPTPESLTFASGALFFVDSDDRLMRAPTDGSADAAELALPPSGGAKPATISDEIAVSRDGSTLAFNAGSTERIWDLYVADAAGLCSNLTNAPDEYPPVGMLPAEPLGPFLALSDDGSRVVYGNENPDLEMFSRATDGSDAPIHLSSDAEFEHSITDGSTVIAFASLALFSFGETVVNQDLYLVDTAAGAPAVSNLTLTSGDASAPFLKGARLRPIVAARAGPSAEVLLVNDFSPSPASPRFDLWSVDAGGGMRRAGGLIAPPRLVAGGPADSRVTLAVIARSTGEQLAVVPASAREPLRVLVDVPAGISLRGVSIRGDGAEAAFVATSGPGFDYVAAVRLADGVVRLLTPVPGFSGGETAYSPSGRVLFSWSATPALSAYAESPISSGSVRKLPHLSGTPRFLAR